MILRPANLVPFSRGLRTPTRMVGWSAPWTPGGRLLSPVWSEDTGGNPMLCADGNPADTCVPCGTNFKQARRCSDNVLADVWMSIADAAIVGTNAFKFGSLCYYFSGADAASSTHGTLITRGDVVQFPSCTLCRGIGPCSVCSTGFAPRTMLALLDGVRECFNVCSGAANVLWADPNGSYDLHAVGAGGVNCPWDAHFTLGPSISCTPHGPVEVGTTGTLFFTKDFAGWHGQLQLFTSDGQSAFADFLDDGSFADCEHDTFDGVNTRTCATAGGTQTIAEGSLVVIPG